MKRTKLLFTRPSSIRGIIKKLDIESIRKSVYSSSKATEADVKALSSDWCSIGNDMMEAMNDFEKQCNYNNDLPVSED